jgi:hypothetical protein
VIPKWVQKFSIGLLVVAASISVSIGIYRALIGPMASFDFQWPSARAIYLHYSPYQIDTLPAETQHAILTTRTVNPTSGDINFASSISFLTPYALVDWRWAKVAWLMSNLIFTGTILSILFRLAGPLSPRTKWALALIFLASTSFRVMISNGQHSLFALAFTLVSIILSANAPILSGIALALGLFKYHLIAPLILVLAIRRRFKPIVTAISIHVGLSVLVSGWIHGNPVQMAVQCISIAKGLQHEGWIDLAATAGRLIPLKMVYGSLAILTTSIAVLIWKRRTLLSDLDILSLMSILSVLAVYHRIYDFILLICPVIWIARDATQHRRLTWGHYVVAGWIVSIWFLEKLMGAGGTESWGIQVGLATWGWLGLGIVIRQSIGWPIGPRNSSHDQKDTYDALKSSQSLEFQSQRMGSDIP